MKKQIIKLTEGDLHQIIENSVIRLLKENEENEGFGNFLKGAWNKMSNDAKTATQSGLERGKERAYNFGNNLRNGVNNMKQKASDYIGQVKQAGQQASNVADAQKAIQSIRNLVAKGILGQNIANMVIGNLKKYGNR